MDDIPFVIQLGQKEGDSDAPGVFIWPLHPWHLDIRLLINFRVNGPGDGSFVVGSG